MLEECLKLSRQTPGLGVIHFPTVKPIDKRRIADLAERPILLFSVEDHEIQGGFGSAIAEELSQYGGKAQLFRFGLSDEFIRSGAPAQIMKHFRLDSEGLGQRVRGVLEREGFA
jgi:transketolase C-terminal domain/subunit